MKSIAEAKFDNVIKESFHKALKPKGFKKKGNNFYAQRNGLGHMINIQKSAYFSKDHIHFTINVGVFLPEYWNAFYNYFNKPIPEYPTEPECILRKRIGDLSTKSDKWFDVIPDSDENKLIQEMNANLNQYILPYFENFLSKEELVEAIDEKVISSNHLEKLIVFGELGYKEKARKEFQKIIADTTRNPRFLENVKTYGERYGLV